MPPPTLEQIINRFWEVHEQAEWKARTDVIPRDQLRQWMKDKDLQVLGFAASMMHDHRFRIEPPIDVNDYVEFVRLYYGRCFVENPDSEWADSRFSAGWDMVGIFCSLWDDSGVPRKVLNDLKKWLADLYRKGDADLRYCLETATLEHLFERAAIRKFFKDWEKDQVLIPGYKNALLWVQRSGKSPMTRKRKS